MCDIPGLFLFTFGLFKQQFKFTMRRRVRCYLLFTVRFELICAMNWVRQLRTDKTNYVTYVTYLEQWSQWSCHHSKTYLAVGQ